VNEAEHRATGERFRARLRASLDRGLTIAGGMMRDAYEPGWLNGFKARLKDAILSGTGPEASEEEMQAAEMAVFADIGLEYVMLTLIEDRLDIGSAGSAGQRPATGD
jgi:hypothetical protein